MKILQTPISDNHKSSMYFEGVIAEHIAEPNELKLVTFQTGEIYFMGNIHVGNQIIELGKQGLIDDNDIEQAIYNDGNVDILVDKFFTISINGVVDEDIIYNDYDEAIEKFENLVTKQ